MDLRQLREVVGVTDEFHEEYRSESERWLAVAWHEALVEAIAAALADLLEVVDDWDDIWSDDEIASTMRVLSGPSEGT